MNKKYITTPIYYSNARPHVGHSHTSVLGDTLKKISQMQGYDVFFTTGVDEHGQKNQAAIIESGKEAQEYLDNISGVYKALFDKLGIDYDFYVRTSAKKHKDVVSHVLQEVYDKGLIEKKEYEGLYCVGCEQFKLPGDLDEKGNCPDHGVPPIKMKEVNYFFKLCKFQDWLIDYINTHPNWIQPEQYKKEILNMLAEPLPDLCISRPKSRIWLGIELPFDHDYVTYVWFDALLNYISSLGYPENKENTNAYWENSTHLMAKDIVKTHCIYWPIMLKAIGLEPPTHCFVHGYWLGEGNVKMSKSIGNVVDPYKMIDIFGVDGYRYFLMRTMGKNESAMSENIILSTYNAELANIIGNGYYRTLKMLDKQNGGIFDSSIKIREEDEKFLQSVVKRIDSFFAQETSLESPYMEAGLMVDIARDVNGFIDKTAPWKLAKDDEPAFFSVINTCLECFRLLFELAYPIMPQTSLKVLKVLNVNFDINNYKVSARKIPNGTLGEHEPLFVRMEKKA